MRRIYRGFELEAKRERTLGGWMSTYLSAVMIDDGWVMIDGIGGDDHLSEMMEIMKKQIDDFYENPSNWEDEDCFDGPEVNDD